MEQETNPDHEQARQRVADFADQFTAIKRRADRSRVKTRYGEQIYDRDVRDEYNEQAAAMNGLLEVLYEQNKLLGLEKLGLDSAEPTPNELPPAVKKLTTVLVKTANEPVPEGFEGLLVELDPDYKDERRKF